MAGKGARCEVRGAGVAWCGEVARCGCGVVRQVTCGEVWRCLDEQHAPAEAHLSIVGVRVRVGLGPGRRARTPPSPSWAAPFCAVLHGEP